MTPVRDPGLQPQRTGLAWWRTCLSTLAVALLCLRTALTSGNPWSLAASVIGAAVAVCMLFVGAERPEYNPERGEVANRQSRQILYGVAGGIVTVTILEICSLIVRRVI